MEQYLKTGDAASYLFPKDWYQVFDHPFAAPRAQNESMVLKTFTEGLKREECRMIGTLLLYLYRTTFALDRQIERYLAQRELLPAEGIAELLAFAKREHLLNCFTFSETGEGKLPEDALRIYCLDHAARYVLGHFYREDVLYTWNRFRALASAPVVSRNLVINDLYLEFGARCRPKVTDMSAPMHFYYNHRNIFLSGGFRVRDETKGIREYLVEVVRSADLPDFWQSKVTEQLAPFLSETHGAEATEPNWRRFFERRPALIFFGDTEEDLAEIGAVYERAVKDSCYRLALLRDLPKGLGSIRLYRYQAETHRAEPTASVLLQLVV